MGFDRLTDLSIRASSMEPRVDGTPLRGLGWMEVAAAMSSLTAEQSDLLRAVYLSDRLALKRTLSKLLVRLSGKPGLSPEMRTSLAVTAVQAFFSLRTCSTCDGVGHVDGETCPSCDGGKLDHLPVSALKTMLNVGDAVWEALCAAPFGELYRELLTWHEEGAAKLNRRVRG